MKLMSMKKEPSLHSRWLLTFILGLCFGIIFANVFGRQYMEDVGLISEYMLNKFKYMEIDSGRLFYYCLEKRLLPVFYIAMFGLTMFGIFVIYLYIGWIGFTTGVIMSVATMKFGAKGILLCLGGVLPQYIIYIPIMLGVMHMAYKNCASLYYQRLDYYSLCGSKKQMILKYIVLLLVFILVAIIGIVFESYVNPKILKKILKLF